MAGRGDVVDEVERVARDEPRARGVSGASGLVPRDVLRYIAQHNLYQS